MELGHIELPSQSYHSSAKVIWKPGICDACREPKVSGLCPGCEQVKDQSFKSRGQPDYYIMHRHLEWSQEKERHGFVGYLTFVIEGHKRWAIYPSTDADFLYKTKN